MPADCGLPLGGGVELDSGFPEPCSKRAAFGGGVPHRRG
jgi:hypothetical protein